MLQRLRIGNLALLESAELEFDKGLIAVTGETGAGKSVLIGALSLLSGSRADKGIVRRGADACEVEGMLVLDDTTAVDAWLREAGLPECEDGVLLLGRMIHREKPQRVAVNGRSTTLANLQALGEYWIDFHGPGEPQKLFHEHWQLNLLDRYARIWDLRERHAADFAAWRAKVGEIERLRTGERLEPEEIEFLQAQIQRIDDVDVSEEGIAQLETDFRRMSQSQDIIRLASGVQEGLDGDQGLLSRLASVRQAAAQLASMDASTSALLERIDAAMIELQDVAGEYANVAGSCDIDEESAAALSRRMEQWMELRRRHGPEVRQVLAKRQALAEKLAMQGNVNELLEAAQGEADAMESRLRKLSEQLWNKRLEAAQALGRQAASLINQLGFKKARLDIEILRDGVLREHGDSSCRIRFAPNAGQELLPLNRIASSGEAARVLLAMKAILAQADATPVLVFDEVDANVGGEIAGIVGRELAGLGKEHQVFCVTHLPQVAAQGHSHFLVEKTQTDDATSVSIAPIQSSRQARISELARMLGDRSSQAAIQHATELLGSDRRPR